MPVTMRSIEVQLKQPPDVKPIPNPLQMLLNQRQIGEGFDLRTGK